MGLREAEFGGVLDGDDALVGGDEAGEEVEEGRLARSRAAGDDDVLAHPDARLHELGGVVRPGSEADEILGGEGAAGELADGERGAREGERGDDRVHARAVRQAGVHVGLRFVDAAPDGGDDAFDDGHHARVVGELEVGEGELAVALDVDLVGAVDHDLRDGVVCEQILQRAQAQGLVEDLAFEARGVDAGREASGGAYLFDDFVDLLRGLALKAVAVDAGDGEALEVEAGDEFLLDLGLRLAEEVRKGRGRGGGRRLVFGRGGRRRGGCVRRGGGLGVRRGGDDAEQGAADLHDGVGRERDGGIDRRVVHVGAVRAVEVLERGRAVPEDEQGVAFGDVGVGQMDAAARAAPDEVGAVLGAEARRRARAGPGDVDLECHLYRPPISSCRFALSVSISSRILAKSTCGSSFS